MTAIQRRYESVSLTVPAKMSINADIRFTGANRHIDRPYSNE